MKILETTYKVFSYIFIGFIVILITLTFGMPDFISTAGDSNRYLAARIGDEILTRSQVSRTQANYIRQYFQGQNLSPEMRKQFENQIFDQLIQNKVRLLMMKDVHFFPIDRSKRHIMVNYLKENFSSYFSEVSQYPEKFKNEILKRNQITYDDLETNVIDDYASQHGQDLLKNIKLVSSPEKILRWLASKTKISYEIAVFDKPVKDSLIKQRIIISQADIQKKFEKDYLSKDPKVKLTQIKRQAIRNSLFKEKEKQVDKELTQEVETFASKNSLRQTIAKYRLKLHLIPEVSLTESMNSKKPSKAPPLNNLENSKKFQEFLAFSKERETKVIKIKNVIYLIRIAKKTQINVKQKSLNYLRDILKKEDTIKTFLNKEKEEISSIEEDTAQKYNSSVLEASIDLKKSQIEIKRFL